MKSLQNSAGLFEVSVPEFKQLKACRREVKMLKSLWDMVTLVQSSFSAWNTTLWRDINVENMEIDCKKFVKVSTTMFLCKISIQYVNRYVIPDLVTNKNCRIYSLYKTILCQGVTWNSLILGSSCDPKIHSVMKSHSLISKLFHTYIFVQRGREMTEDHKAISPHV